MTKREYPETFWLILIILGIMIIFSGCIGEENKDNGIPMLNESSPANSTGIIRTPTPETIVSDDYDPGVLPPIIPNETNTIKVNITATPEPKTYLFSLEEAPQLTTGLLLVPTYLPQGFRYQGGSLISNGVISLQMSNITTTVTYIQAPEWCNEGEYLVDASVECTHIYANDLTFRCSEVGTLHQLFWTDNYYDYYLISELDCDELLLMAGSLKPLDYEILDQIPYTVSDPENPYPVPERIRLLFPLAWINAHYPDKYHSHMLNITMSSDEFNASFSPDPRDHSILRHNEVQEEETVVYLSLPREMFDFFSVEPGKINIIYSEDFFIGFGNMESLYEFHWKDPYPPDFKARNPYAMGTTTVPMTLVSS